MYFKAVWPIDQYQQWVHLVENSGQCTCCEGIFKCSKIKSFSVHIDKLPDKTFGLQFMCSFLRYHMYEKVDVFGSRHSVHISELFSRFYFLICNMKVALIVQLCFSSLLFCMLGYKNIHGYKTETRTLLQALIYSAVI